MADLADIRQAIADALSAIPDVQVSPYNPASPVFPVLFVLGHGEIDYGNLGFGRLDTQWNLIVRGYVSTNLDITSQQRLDRWLASEGDHSVKAAIEDDPTLGGVVEWALVRRSIGSNLFKLSNTVSALGTDFTVQVQTTD
jgi:hypothetical protein